MSCRSCGLGPSPIKKSASKPVAAPIVNRSVPTKAKIESNVKKKTSIPTRSPARTFPSVGE